MRSYTNLSFSAMSESFAWYSRLSIFSCSSRLEYLRVSLSKLRSRIEFCLVRSMTLFCMEL